ncbi:serine protease [Cereibacter sphaeroides]|uniref:trypsin-like serine peptidase n=1 Tax=Cereibacter sphaeroides TaxID=1063 RepID=UPI001F341361|nr:serine protease [Cereibacter sphaeroides]MCE6949832.1 serine protease [Cereibacter sphaeroides]
MERHDRATIDLLAARVMPRLGDDKAVLESAEGARDGADLSPAGISERIERSEATLRGYIEHELGGDPALEDLARRMLQTGREGLELIAGRREETAAPLAEVAAALEVVVHTDGSRPAFLVREDAPVFDSSPPGIWVDLLADPLRDADLRTALKAVARIDITHPLMPYAGTGWLVAPDLVATNRHVAQVFVSFPADGAPVIRHDLAPRIDFGHEFNGRESADSQPLTDLVFCGAKPIPPVGIDHDCLDIAVFRLGAPAPADRKPLALGEGQRLALPQTQVFVAGYPARPDPASLGSVSETDRVLRLLFEKLWGFKRLAPGEVTPTGLGARTLNHDATTLGGNSGSLVMGIDSLPFVTGIHYGGNWGSDRTNWAHVLGSVLDEPGLPGLRHASLADLCAAEGVQRRVF